MIVTVLFEKPTSAAALVRAIEAVAQGMTCATVTDAVRRGNGCIELTIEGKAVNHGPMRSGQTLRNAVTDESYELDQKGND